MVVFGNTHIKPSYFLFFVPHTHGRGVVVPQPCGLVTYNPITNYGTKSFVYIVITFLTVTVISKLFIRRMSGIEYGW